MEQTLWVIKNMCGHPRTHEVLPLSMSCLISLSVLICDVWRSVRHLLSSPNLTGFHHFYHHRFLSSRSVCLTGRFTAPSIIYPPIIAERGNQERREGGRRAEGSSKSAELAFPAAASASSNTEKTRRPRPCLNVVTSFSGNNRFNISPEM